MTEYESELTALEFVADVLQPIKLVVWGSRNTLSRRPRGTWGKYSLLSILAYHHLWVLLTHI